MQQGDEGTRPPVVKFHTFDLLHRHGFRDGDLLVDVAEAAGLEVDRDALLVAVVERLVLPRLDQRVEPEVIVTLHNPIRARTVDGSAATIDSVLTPAVVEVAVDDVLEVARQLHQSS